MVFGELGGVEKDGWCLERWVVLREMGGVWRNGWCWKIDGIKS